MILWPVILKNLSLLGDEVFLLPQLYWELIEMGTTKNDVVFAGRHGLNNCPCFIKIYLFMTVISSKQKREGGEKFSRKKLD